MGVGTSLWFLLLITLALVDNLIIKFGWWFVSPEKKLVVHFEGFIQTSTKSVPTSIKFSWSPSLSESCLKVKRKETRGFTNTIII